MNLSVGEALEKGLIENVKVLAGSRGLNREIKAVSFLDAPDAVNWIKGNELVLTTAYPFKDNVKEQIEIIEQLDKKGAAALAIKWGRFIGEPSKVIIKDAQERNFPLLGVPDDIAWVDIIIPVMKEILSRKTAYLERTFNAHNILFNEAIKGGGLKSIVKTASNILGNPINIITYFDGAIYSEPESFFVNLSPSATKTISDIAFITDVSSLTQRHYQTQPSVSQLISPIVVNQSIEGKIVAWEIYKPLDQFAKIVLEQTAMVAALEIQRLKSVNEVYRRFQSDFLLEVLCGNVTSEAFAYARGQELGINFSQQYAVILLNAQKRDMEGVEKLKGSWSKDLHIYETVVKFSNKNNDYLCGMDGKGITFILFPLDKKFGIKEFEYKLRHELETSLKNLLIHIGISSSCMGITGLARGYKEAMYALKIANLQIKKGTTIFYENLDLYRLITSHETLAEVKRIYKETLGILREYDKKNKTDLLNTLKTFLQMNCSYRETGRKMFLHHNTVRYRINIIENLCNVNLEQLSDQLKLLISIYFEQMLEKIDNQ